MSRRITRSRKQLDENEITKVSPVLTDNIHTLASYENNTTTPVSKTSVTKALVDATPVAKAPTPVAATPVAKAPTPVAATPTVAKASAITSVAAAPVAKASAITSVAATPVAKAPTPVAATPVAKAPTS